MGSWGVGSFDNDESRSWLLNELDVHDVQEALSIDVEVATTKQCVLALAAAELIALALGAGGPSAPASALLAAERLRAKLTAQLARSAANVVRRIEDRSSLQELQDYDGERYDAWHVGVLNLASRLESGSPGAIG